MIRRNVYLKSSQIKFLKELNELNLSEHVRRATDEYIKKIETTRVSGSLSKKVGESDG